MNLTIIPFHDWRKNQKEGFRTRDSHLIKALSKTSKVNKILVINRPTTILELIYKKTSKKIDGKVLISSKGFTLYEVDESLYVVDFISNDIIGQAIKKQKWFFNKYIQDEFIQFIKDCWEKLKFDNPYLISQNIFAYKLVVKLSAEVKMFDAWDNFLKFPAYKNLNIHLKKGYEELAKSTKYWTTNSIENVNFFKKTFGVKNVCLLKNGVEINFSNKKNILPDDMVDIKKPIIGFGGKISYLLNVDLINYLIKDNKDLSFVFVGQILNKQVYNAIQKAQNVYFLGDKHYDVYPYYVKNFDICIIPYNIGDKQHGGDSIKAYEYLSTQKKVVGTNGNGLEDLKEYIYITNTPQEFSDALKDTNNLKPKIDITKYSWKSKALSLIKILNGENI